MLFRSEVLERFPRATYVRLLPKTGRTHQLRVHMQSLGNTLLADSLYGGRSPVMVNDVLPRGANRPADASRVLIERQALHAFRLAFKHPMSGASMEFEAPFHADMQQTLEFLRTI